MLISKYSVKCLGSIHVKVRPLWASGLGKAKRRSLVLWFTSSEFSSRKDWPPKPEKTFGGGDNGDSDIVREVWGLLVGRVRWILLP